LGVHQTIYRNDKALAETGRSEVAGRQYCFPEILTGPGVIVVVSQDIGLRSQIQDIPTNQE
jgi:hypothetical protein